METAESLQVGLKALLVARILDASPDYMPHFLFLRRTKNAMWTIPGGRIDTDLDRSSSIYPAMSREVTTEETGIEIVLEGEDEPFPVALQEIPENSTRPRVIRVTSIARPVLPGLVEADLSGSNEHSEAMWATLPQARGWSNVEPITADCLRTPYVEQINQQLTLASQLGLATLQAICLHNPTPR